MRKLVIFFIFIGVLFSVSLAYGYTRKLANGYLEERTMHFIVCFHKNVNKEFIKKIKKASESNYMTIVEDLYFFRDDPWTFDNRATIYVHKDRTEYLKETGMPDWSYGMADLKEKEIHTYEGTWSFVKRTLRHEMTHLIFRDYIGNRADLPLWLNEGAAVYMEHKKTRKTRAYSVKRLFKEEYIPLRELCVDNYLEPYGISASKEERELGDNVNKFYDQSLSLLYFLIKRYDRFKFNMLCKSLKTGKNFDEVFFSTYRSIKDYDDLEKKWKRFYLK